ncbi:MAG: phage tail protein [Casimicrobium sp.]
MSITEALMLNGEITVESRNTKNIPTVMRVWYTDRTATGWVEDFAEASLPGAGTTLRYDVSEIRLPAIFRYSHAYREAVERLNELTLNDLSISFVTRDQALKLLPGDLIEVTHSVGFAAKKFRVLATEPVEAGRYRISAREFDPAKYSNVVVTGPTYADTNLPDPGTPPDVTGLAAQEISETPTTSRIAVTWAANTTWPFLVGYRVLIYDEERLVVNDAPTVAGLTTPPLPVGRRYQIRVAIRSSLAEGRQAPAYITLAGVSTEIPGEMLWGEFDIRPASGFDQNTGGSPAWRHGYADALEGRAYRYGGSDMAAPIEPYKWQELPDASQGDISTSPFSSVSQPLDTYLYWAQTSAPLLPSAVDYAPPPLEGAIQLWQSQTIAPWGAPATRRGRFVADLPLRNIGAIDFLPAEVRIYNLATSENVANNGTANFSFVNVRVYTPAGAFSKSCCEIGWPGKLRVYLPTVTEATPESAPISVPSSGVLVVTMQRVYEKLRSLPRLTAVGSEQRTLVVDPVITYSATSTTFTVRAFDGSAPSSAQFTYFAEGVEKF